MSAFGEARVILTADDKTAGAFKSVQSSLNGMVGMAARFVPALSVAAFGGLIKGAIDAADNLNDLSKTTGASVETLAGLQLAAKQSGTELETVARGMLKFSGVVLDASNGSKEAANKISALGLNLKTLQAQSPEQQFIALAGALEKFGAEKQGVIVADVLGQKMASLTPLLSEGAKGLGEMLEAGKKLNPITTEMAKQADKFNDSMEEMKAKASGLAISLANPLLPKMNDIIEAMQRAQKESGTLAALFMGLGGTIVAAFGGETNNIKRLDNQINELFNNILEKRNNLNKWSKNPVTDFLNFGDREREKLDAMQKKLGALVATRDKLQGAAAETSANANKPKQVEDFKKPQTEKKAKTKKDDLGSVDDYASRINQAVAGAINDSAIVKARELEDQIAALDKLFFDLGLNADIYSSAMDKLTKAQDGTSDAGKRLADMLGNTAGAQLEKDRADMLLLADAYERGKISVEQFIEAAQARLGLVKEAGTDTFSELKNAVEGWGKSFTDSMADMVMNGKLNFSDMADSIIRDLVRMSIQASITKPLFDSFQRSDWMAAASTFFTGNANGGVYNSPSLSAYSGGVYNSPHAFAFAKGAGIFGEAGAEAIMPLRRGADGKLGVSASGAGVVVNIIESPDKGGQTQQRSEGGQNILDVFVEKVKSSINRDVARGDGLAGVLEGKYGLNPAAGARR